MGAFILAGIVIIATLAIAFLQSFAVYMSTTGTGDSGAGSTLIWGFMLAAIIAASHWMPHIGW